MRLSICWPCSVTLHGLTLRGQVAVIPSHFHFVMIPLTVVCGIFRNKEISQVASYHSTMLEFTELLRATHSFTNVCRTVCMTWSRAWRHQWWALQRFKCDQDVFHFAVGNSTSSMCLFVGIMHVFGVFYKTKWAVVRKWCSMMQFQIQTALKSEKSEFVESLHSVWKRVVITLHIVFVNYFVTSPLGHMKLSNATDSPLCTTDLKERLQVWMSKGNL